MNIKITQKIQIFWRKAAVGRELSIKCNKLESAVKLRLRGGERKGEGYHGENTSRVIVWRPLGRA
jgi:hypothetical protein